MSRIDREGGEAAWFGVPAWLLFWLAVAGVSIFLHGPLPLYSTRTLSAAWEMWLRGDFLVPYLNGAPYSHKTPLLYWMIHAGWALFGVSDVWPRVLEVLIGGATLGLAARLAARLFPDDPRPARWVPWLLLGGSYFFLFSLQLMYEVLLCACVLGALSALARGDQPGARPNWGGVAIAIALGLLTKGPVMLLHVAPALLAGPWWARAAQRDPARWYRATLLAVLAGAAAFACWVVPAIYFGGAQYRHMLLWTQTAGRVVQSFDHARPFWWYLQVIPALCFPWLFWRPALAGLRAGFSSAHAGARLLTLWLVSLLLVFSLVSGKQVYYLLPQFVGFAILFAHGMSGRVQRKPLAADRPWLLGALLIALGSVLALLPELIERLHWGSMWLSDFSQAPRALGIGVAVCGLFLLVARSATQQVRAIAIAVCVSTALAHAAFSLTSFRRYDLGAIANKIATAQAQGHPAAHVGTYEAQFQFLGRMSEPVLALSHADVAAWAAAHPDGLLVEYPRGDLPGGAAGPLILQAFRQRRIALWQADTWLAAQREASADDSD